MRTYAVILAGGSGSRMGLEEPKQFARVAGRTVLEHSVAAFVNAPDIDEVIVVVLAEWREQVNTLMRAIKPEMDTSSPVPIQVVSGGATRSESSQCGLAILPSLADLPEGDAKVLIHDAARPLISQRIIADCLQTLDSAAAVTVGIPASDTVMEVDETGRLTSVLDRARIRLAQTPQGFRLSVIRDAYDKAREQGKITTTDDAGVVLAYRPDVPIVCLPGEQENIKITHRHELTIAQELFRQQGKA